MALPTSNEGAYDLRSLMRPRMYGSTDIQRLRTSTWPAPGSGTGTASTLKSLAFGMPTGRAASTICRLTRRGHASLLKSFGAEQLGAPAAHAFHLREGGEVARGIVGQPVDEPLREDDAGIELHELGRLDPPRPERLAAPLHRRRRCAAAGFGRRTGSSSSAQAHAPRSTAARMASPARRTTLGVQPLTVEDRRGVPSA